MERQMSPHRGWVAPLQFRGDNLEPGEGPKHLGDIYTAITGLKILEDSQENSVRNDSCIKDVDKLILTVDFDFSVKTTGLIVGAITT